MTDKPNRPRAIKRKYWSAYVSPENEGMMLRATSYFDDRELRAIQRYIDSYFAWRESEKEAGDG